MANIIAISLGIIGTALLLLFFHFFGNDVAKLEHKMFERWWGKHDGKE